MAVRDASISDLLHFAAVIVARRYAWPVSRLARLAGRGLTAVSLIRDGARRAGHSSFGQ